MFQTRGTNLEKSSVLPKITELGNQPRVLYGSNVSEQFTNRIVPTFQRGKLRHSVAKSVVLVCSLITENGKGPLLSLRCTWTQ